jgi:hypothetical protein
MKCVRRFGIKGKLPATLVHTLSSISMGQRLIKWSYQQSYRGFIMCFMSPNSTDVVIEDTIPLEHDLTYKSYPIKILDQHDQVTHNKTTRFYKTQWNDHSEDEAMWELEEFL